MSTRPDTASVLAGLKDFQRETVDYVFDRFYGKSPTRRFLVADEVGLGKTLVARGVIARTIDLMWKAQRQITIVYVCSNADIASQNIKRLNISGCSPTERSTRITLLPLELANLKNSRVNLIALTAGTSFDPSKKGGHIQERALLYWMLRKAWPRVIGSSRRQALNVLCNHADVDSFQRQVDNLDRSKISRTLAQSFAEALKERVEHERINGEEDLKMRFRDLRDRFHRKNARTTPEDTKLRTRWIGDMRRLLAKVCLNSIDPDLVIFDEFQRFSHLLNKEAEAGALAQALFDSGEGSDCRLLLLSATPYKSVSLHHEKDADAPNEFVTLVKALEDNPESDFQQLLDGYRAALPAIRSPEGLEAMKLARGRIQERLRRVMVRTEKHIGDFQQANMLSENASTGIDMTVDDVRAFMGTQDIAAHISAGDMVEYWKSSPYLFNFMEHYSLKKVFKEWKRDAGMAQLVQRNNGTFLNYGAMQSYRRVEAPNPRLRLLEEETVGVGMWKLLWMPPSLGYYKPSDGPYAERSLSNITKRLVFSSWHVVPRAAASLLSYEAERRMMCGGSPSGRATMEQWQKQKALLRFEAKAKRLSGLPLFNLVYPCLTFARDCDPRHLPQGRTSRGVITILKKRIRQMTSDLKLSFDKDGKADERWYWLLPILLDEKHFPAASSQWWETARLAREWAEPGKPPTEGWENHVTTAWKTLRGVMDGTINLGRPPKDLPGVLALTASSGPATAAFRALGRASETPIHDCLPTRFAAARVGWSFLSLFNHPEVTSLIRSKVNKGAYWRCVLAYSHGGQIQAVLDEYVHVLAGSIGGSSNDFSSISSRLSEEIIHSVGLRAAPLSADHIKAYPGARTIDISEASMRLRFAMRFGEEKEDEGGTGVLGGLSKASRKERVRAAFNSPFWPFVLVSTSVGQEGLDFHHYCHAITHWNLPANPVDLEQREGRIHRFKGHAIRKNVAEVFGAKALKAKSSDPWAKVFELAVRRRRRGENDLVPFWHFPGSAKIERHVPALPYSREKDRIEGLRRALVVYRMVLGQSRQEDLIAYLLSEIPEAEQAGIVAELQINLRPPRRHSARR